MRLALARAVLRLAALLRRRPGGNAYGEVFAPGAGDVGDTGGTGGTGGTGDEDAVAEQSRPGRPGQQSRPGRRGCPTTPGPRAS